MKVTTTTPIKNHSQNRDHVENDNEDDDDDDEELSPVRLDDLGL